MPRGHIVPVQLLRPLEQGTEFEISVAVDAGVGGLSPLIGAGEAVHHLVMELAGEVEHIKRKAQLPGHRPGVLHIVQGAAAALPLHAHISVVKQLHGHADEVVARLFQNPGRRGAVHAAAHGNGHLCAHAASPSLEHWVT